MPEPRIIKALTVRQPWAWLIIHGGKDIENRDWWTNLRGRVAIHASARFSRAEWAAATMHIRLHKIEGPMELYSGGLPMKDELEFGAIIGTVEIADCVSTSASPWFVGEHGFVLRDPIALPKPIPAKGALGFWDWEVPEGVQIA